MTAAYTVLTAFFLLGSAGVSFAFFIRDRKTKQFLTELFVLFALALGLYFLTGFPIPKGHVAFGGTYSSGFALALMFAGVVLGIVASVFYNAAEVPTLASFLKPIMVAPIITLPLVASLQGASLELIQLASITLLSFQNGFFWREVLSNVKIPRRT